MFKYKWGDHEFVVILLNYVRYIRVMNGLVSVIEKKKI